MAVTIATASVSAAIALKPGESVAFSGVKTGTTTLVPKMSADGTNYFPIASPTDITTTVSFTDTFGWIELTAPTKSPTTRDHYLFRLENTSGAGSWSVEGVPA